MKRDAAQTIFRTVVFAGAMLGTGCGGKKPQPAASNTATQPAATDTTNATPADPCAGSAADPCAANNPCRPRPNPDPCARPTGRGFVLS